MNNDIVGLRDLLFDALRGIKDGSVDVDQAKAISAVASEISKTARLEIDYMVKTGKIRRSEFIEAERIEGITPTFRLTK